jgi:putative two-component system response regulator
VDGAAVDVSSAEPPVQPKIMIVDDEPINIKLVQKYLRMAKYSQTVTTTDSTQAIALLRKERPDLVLLDIMMPKVSGLDILGAIRADQRLFPLPVLILTAATDRETRLKALELGATDFLAKPVDDTELIPRVRSALVVKAHHDYLTAHAQQLEEQVRTRTAELTASRLELIHCLARVAEYRDDQTGRHVIRVGRYAGMIARELGMDDEFVDLLVHAAPLHDIGEVGIPDAILQKPGRLTPEEYELMQNHCRYGKRTVAPMSGDEWRAFQTHTLVGEKIIAVSHSPILEMAGRIALTHHEKWDGSGYPLGLAGDSIPIEARITAVADVFDALSTKRHYKPAFPLENCFEIMRQGRGSHFDPRVLDAFLARKPEIVQIRIEHADFE